MPDPRDYKRSTIFALATLGQGTCYWPEPPCKVRATVVIDGYPVTNVQIAHIRAAKPNGPRYYPDMSDHERRLWPNLILLCTPHHNVIDKIRPADYPIEKLEKWKSDREAGGLAQLKGLDDLTEDRLQDMIAYSMKEGLKEIRAMIAQHKPIDSDAAMLLSEAASHLNVDTAENLYEASALLTPALSPDNVETLYEAASLLSRALEGSTATNIQDAADSLYEVIATLDARIAELRRIQEDM